MGTARFDQINVVVADPRATAEFLAALGVDITATGDDWDAHHRNIPAASNFEADLDSTQFARHWGGLPDGFSGVVVNLRTSTRDEVDALYDRALAAGADGLCAPYDAFWGSRFAVVMAPGPLAVGLISEPDPDHRAAPPSVAEFI